MAKHMDPLSKKSSRSKTHTITNDTAVEIGEVEEYDTLFPEPTVSINRPPVILLWLLILASFIVLLLIGYKVVNGKLDNWLTITPKPTEAATATATPTSSATATLPVEESATPTATATIDPKSKITLRVLNGTTVSGAASRAKDILEKSGFTVKSVGNAKQRSYAATVVYYQKGYENEASTVAKALPTYSTSIVESTLASPDMVLVVTGTK